MTQPAPAVAADVRRLADTAPPGASLEDLVEHVWHSWAGAPPHRHDIAHILQNGHGATTTEPSGLPDPIDWPAFWQREHRTEDWALPSILPAGRQGTIWAKRKTGKSLLSLDLCAAAATGRPILGQDPVPPLEVIYLDLEMTEDDLEERLIDFGYGPDDDLSRLHYYLLPSLPPLNDYAGGLALMELVERHKAQLVVIDTLSRVVTGKENDSDTIQGYYRCTGILLKRAGVSALRLDHGGKEPDKGERGSSAKGDDVDLSWELRPAGGNEYLLHQSFSRLSWVPEQLKIRRLDEPLRHVIADDNWPAGTEPCAQHLDRLQVHATTSVNDALKALRDADVNPRRKAVVAAAQRWRRHPDRRERTPEPLREPPPTPTPEPSTGTTGTNP